MSPSTQQTDAGGDRIDMSSSADVEHWTRTLGVSREQLATVIAITGDRADAVAAYLREEGRPAGAE